MASNIEIKAKATQFNRQQSLARALADKSPLQLIQEDVFFHSHQGRLKLRRFGDGSAELIAYHRPNQEHPSASHYVRHPVSDSDSLEKALTMTCGLRGIVRKKRTVFFYKSVRIHMDEVDQLGQFIELEVVLTDGLSEIEGKNLAQVLMKQLEIKAEHLQAEAYIDMLENASAPPHSPQNPEQLPT